MKVIVPFRYARYGSSGPAADDRADIAVDQAADLHGAAVPRP